MERLLGERHIFKKQSQTWDEVSRETKYQNFPKNPSSSPPPPKKEKNPPDLGVKHSWYV
jgi:hypothetical protein